MTLTNILEKYKSSSFSWGEFDCCIFVATVIEEHTGKQLPYWKEVLTYKNYKESVKALKKLGCKKIEDLPGVILNKPKRPVSEVKHGDPVYYINEDGVGILGICNGVRAYFLQKGGGLTARSIDKCKYCWNVN